MSQLVPVRFIRNTDAFLNPVDGVTVIRAHSAGEVDEIPYEAFTHLKARGYVREMMKEQVAYDPQSQTFGKQVVPHGEVPTGSQQNQLVQKAEAEGSREGNLIGQGGDVPGLGGMKPLPGQNPTIPDKPKREKQEGVENMTEEKGKYPAYKGAGVAIWKNTDKNGEMYLTVQILGKNGPRVNCFKYTPKPNEKQEEEV
jgi:hypothetical protein